MLYLIITKYFFCCFVFVLFACLFVCLFVCFFFVVFCFFFSSGLIFYFCLFFFLSIKLVNKNTKISIKALPGYPWVKHFHQQVDLAKMSEMQQTDRQTQKLIHVHHYKYRMCNLRSPIRQRRVQDELFTCIFTFSYIDDWTNLRTWKRWSTLLIWCFFPFSDHAIARLGVLQVKISPLIHNMFLFYFF